MNSSDWWAANSPLKAASPNSAPGGHPDGLQGSVAHFGTYVVDPTTHTIELHIRKGTFPNWDGEIQARPFVIEGDRLTYITPGSFGYGASTAVWQRDKGR